jgi:hypothetical protein
MWRRALSTNDPPSPLLLNLFLIVLNFPALIHYQQSYLLKTLVYADDALVVLDDPNDFPF